MNKLRLCRVGKNGFKNLAISIVILIEVLVLCVVASYAWVETVSSIKIINESGTKGTVASFIYTDATITSQKDQWTKSSGVIDLADYFKKSGNMHLAPASSADGVNFYFPQVGTTTAYRKGNVSDKNTTYLSATFRLKAETDVDFFFYKPNSGNGPSFSATGSDFNDRDIRVSVTAYSEGQTPTDEDTKIYSLLTGNATTATENVVNGRASTDLQSVTRKSFASSVKGTGSLNSIFSVNADETKVVTINLWLQSNSTNMNGNGVYSRDITISDLGLISSITPRHVSLVPTSVWNSNNPVYYAWCYDSAKQPDQLYKLTDNGDGSYSFDYPGDYDKVVFVRAKTGVDDYDRRTTWPFQNGEVWNQTSDLQIPNTPIDPTFFVTAMNYNNSGKSNGVWEVPTIVRLRYSNVKLDPSDANTNYGTLTATHDGYTAQFNNEDNEVRLVTRCSVSGTNRTFTAKTSVPAVSNQTYSSYAFDGWYLNEDASTNATGFTTTTSGLNTSSSHNTEILPLNKVSPELIYYAKFKAVRTVKVNQYKDNENSMTSVAGKLYIDSTEGTSSVSKQVDKGTEVEIHGEPNAGYSLSGIYTARNGGSEIATGQQKETRADGYTYYTVPINNHATYFARFTTNSYSVTAYSSTGGKVSVNNQTANATSSTASIKHGTPVSITASPDGGYEFDGWYTAAMGGTLVSNDATISHTVNAADYSVYARFKVLDFYLTGYINKAAKTTADNNFKFTFNSSDNTYTLTKKFTDSGDGKQYVTLYNGSKAYHPATVNAGSGTKYTRADADDPNEDNKWMVYAPKGTTVTFTFDISTSILSWTIDSRELYLKPNSNWTSDSAWFAAYAYGDGDNWYKMTSAGSGYYKVTIPGNYPNIIFCRMKSNDTTTLAWSNKWNQTGDLTIPTDNKNCFTIPDGAWDGSTTTWSLY